MPLFGGRRAIRVRAGSRSFASGIDTLADSPIKDCRIVIEAGELRPESPLRKACERAKTAVAIACYPDGERDLAKLIDDELRASNLRIAPDARASLTALLGGDRQASRNELRKLALYAHGKGEVTLEDVMAVVADASELKIDPIVDGAFAGRPDLVETEFAKAMVAGTYPGMIISAAQRQAAWLHKTALAAAEGTPVSTCSTADFRACIFRARPMSKPRCAISMRRGWSRSSTNSRRGPGDAQAGLARGRDRPTHAAVDRGERQAARVRSDVIPGVRQAAHPGMMARASALRLQPLQSPRRADRGRDSGSRRCRRDRGDRR